MRLKGILITGGLGFIGSHTCSILLENNFKLYLIDNLENSSGNSIEYLKSLELLNKKNKFENRLVFKKGDIKNFDFLKEVFQIALDENFPIDSVMHFAGLKSVSDSVIDPINYWETNVFGTINLLKVMDIYNCNTLVFSSSATIYGNEEASYFKESSIVKPINPYGRTKAVIEKFLADIFASNPNKWKIANLRYFNPIGSHPSGKLGEESSPKVTNIFPIIMNAASGVIKNLEVYGNNWPTYDGTCIRDYIHVMDLADAHIAALRFLFKKKSYFININIGTGKGTSVLDLIRIFERVNSCKVPYIFKDKRPGDVALSVAKNDLAKNLFNWTPKKSIEDMCRDGWRWQNQSKN